MLEIESPSRNPEVLLGRVAAVLASVFDAEPAEIDPETIVRDLPNADSVRLLESIIVLEEAFGVTLPDDQMFQIETVGALVALIAHAPARMEA